MKTAKIYGITRTKTFQMDEMGNGFSLHPWGNDTEHYQGYDDGGVDYIVPEGYHVAEDMTGTMRIYPDGEKFPCTLLASKDGIPTITANVYEGYITLKKA